MRPKKYPYSQKRPSPSRERVANYRIAIEDLNALLPSSSDLLKEKIEETKQRHLAFLKPWDFEFAQDELESQLHAE